MKKNGIILIICLCVILTAIITGCVNQNSNEDTAVKNTVSPAVSNIATTPPITPTINNEAREALQSAFELRSSIDIIMGSIKQNGDLYRSHSDELSSQINKNQYDFPLLLNHFQTDIDNLDRTQSLMNDLNVKITIFSGDTVKWHGDTRTYAEQASSQMRQIYNDIADEQSNERGMITNTILYVKSAQQGKPDVNYYNKVLEYTNKANTSREQMNKDWFALHDILKKIEQLQNQ
jgi:hypothetical protein